MFRLLLSVVMLGVTSLAAAEPQVFQSEDQRALLVELYTSEGCNSCPPADEWLSELKQRDTLWKQFVPVAFHVDYWNYLGWRDKFATAEFSNRQRLYRHQGATRGVYTPGFLVGGEEWRRWFWGFRNFGTSDQVVGPLNVSVKDQQVTAQFDPSIELDGPFVLNVAVLGMDIESFIAAGENRNKTLEHDFVVLGFKKMEADTPHWRGSLPEFDASQAKRFAIAAWVSQGANQLPIQATGGWFNSGS